MNKRKALLALPLILLFLVTGCIPSLQERGRPPTPIPTDRVITLAKLPYEKNTVLNSTLRFIIEVGYGYTVAFESIEPSGLPEALTSGRVDLALGARQPDNAEWFDNAAANGEIVDLGPTYEADGHAYHSAVHPDIVTQAVDVYDMLQKMEIVYRRLNETDNWYQEHSELGTQRLAVYFLWNYDYEDNWKSWMPYNPAERVRQSLDFFTGLPSGDPYRGIETKRQTSRPTPTPWPDAFE